jgi:hypothetical protein
MKWTRDDIVAVAGLAVLLLLLPVGIWLSIQWDRWYTLWLIGGN